MKQTSVEFIKLYNYVLSKPNGAVLDYDTVERETGINMAQNSGHRNKLSRAILKAGRRALVFPGLGYELDDVKNTMTIVDKAGQRVFRQVKRSSRTTKVVTVRYAGELPAEDQLTLKTIGQMYGFLERKSTVFEQTEIKLIKNIPSPDFGARK
jgi:hypothetical protein